MIYEDRSSYDPASDPVAKIALTVECAPGQVDSITDYLATVASKAGVYSVDVGVDIHIPPVNVEIPKPDPVAPAEPPKEQPNGEQALEQPDHEPQAAVGSGAESTGNGNDEVLGSGSASADGGDQGVGVGAEPSSVGNDSVEGVGSAAIGIGQPEPVGDGEPSVVAGAPGEVGPGSVERGP